MSSSSVSGSQVVTVKIDGGCRDNPGPGAWGVVIESLMGIEEFSGFLPRCTNNQAEYRALNAACFLLIQNQDRLMSGNQPKIEIFSDSQLVVNQINRLWSVKDETLRPFFDSALSTYKALSELVPVTLQWFRREHNSQADALCNAVMDRHGIVCSKKGIKRDAFV